jgi:hypothetical protein
MNLFLAVTDNDWFRFLRRERPGRELLEWHGDVVFRG